jgi:hypothetical protein
MVRVGTPELRGHGRATITVAIGGGQVGDRRRPGVEARGGRVTCIRAADDGGILQKAWHRAGHGTPSCGEDRSHQRGQLVRRDGIGVAVLDIHIRTVVACPQTPATMVCVRLALGESVPVTVTVGAGYRSAWAARAAVDGTRRRTLRLSILFKIISVQIHDSKLLVDSHHLHKKYRYIEAVRWGSSGFRRRDSQPQSLTSTALRCRLHHNLRSPLWDLSGTLRCLLLLHLAAQRAVL